jgi:hypothetical protein
VNGSGLAAWCSTRSDVEAEIFHADAWAAPGNQVIATMG